jgi:hypothetical protein
MPDNGRHGILERTDGSTALMSAVWFGAFAFVSAAGAAAAQSDAQNVADQASPPTAPQSGQRQALDDAWWTGPIFASTATTLPQGHYLIEPDFYDLISYGSYDDRWAKQASARTNAVRSLSFLIYGVTDSFTAGVLPRFGFNEINGSADSGLRIGDTTVRLQYRVAQFREGGSSPALSLVLDETFPTGSYDELGTRPSGGIGSGAYETTASAFSQYYFWVGNGRILRTRLDVSYEFADSHVKLKDVSVYGTGSGFRGYAEPGSSFVADLAFEYSLTMNWVPVLELIYEHDGSTGVIGYGTKESPIALISASVQMQSGSRDAFTLAPAIEYNWSKSVGVIVGVAATVAGRNTSATVMPVVGINMFY